MNYVLNTGCGDFLNAEDAKITQKTQKKTEKRIPKSLRLGFSKAFFIFNCLFVFVSIFVSIFDSLSVFLLRPLRNLCALCVQKSPSSSRVASPL